MNGLEPITNLLIVLSVLNAATHGRRCVRLQLGCDYH